MIALNALTTQDRAIGSIALTYPIVSNGQQLSTLYIRRPTVADRIEVERAMKLGQTEGDVMMLARLTGVLPDDIRSMDDADYAAALEAAMGFLPPTWQSAMDDLRAAAILGTSAGGSLLAGLAAGKTP